MTFTALHKYLGYPSGPVTDDLVADAVAAGLPETFDLDWKGELPPTKNLKHHDFPKDVAAMANSGGGTIVFGVTEKEKAATGRKGVGPLTEGHERTLRQAAVTSITPPVFGLQFYPVGEPGEEAVVMVVPASVDGPHLIYNNDFFGAPIRNGADTTWMREGQIEAAYKARFDERRHSTEVLDSLYEQAATGKDTSTAAWLIAVAHPRVPRVGQRLDQEDARTIWDKSRQATLDLSFRGPAHPLERVTWINPRPGLRRWVAPPEEGSVGKWNEAWIETHHDGSVSIAAAVGASRHSHDGYNFGNQIVAEQVESTLSDFFAVMRETAKVLGIGEYEVKASIEWEGDVPLQFETINGEAGVARPIPSFFPVTASVQAGLSHEELLEQARTFTQDFLNQGGIAELRNFHVPNPLF
ncbi:AlbA family DNA-binding domain-containing protein [Actinomyces minihominis]|uniref:AlbA family DNA-binding domain-containing protein n=1 Tax=Actinomyces minihominis TaxID=2002838 RepID=UPI000C0747A0|nr:ATP-binding protein [Actinomyces minihominis]